ncbi:hypothetical protein [Paenibacillus agri]|uniref:Uncharacterized protein n=1 Tax=Paenibacillus agri TaxID=2744309 RepID=A0A850EJK1_9BACL|nr:hypothetical protein [Paenibacillus agri]NUU61118.1 hypothetical protein [Paenibacillus agri]
MNDETHRILEITSSLVIKKELSSDYIQKKIDSEQGMACKRLAFSESLYEGILRSSSQIINALLQNEPDLYSIKRYYLKPLLEDFVNIYNINKFGKEYARAMQVHFMSEDYDIDSKYRNDYDQLGVSFNKSEEESKEHVAQKMNDHFKKLPSNLSREFKGRGSRRMLPISARISLANLPNYNNISLKALYDYANVHHHFDLRFDWLVEENDIKFTNSLLLEIEDIVKKSSEIFHELFKIN